MHCASKCWGNKQDVERDAVMNAFQETSELFESLHEARLRAIHAQRSAALHGVLDARVALGRVVVALEVAEDACREAHAVTRESAGQN
ncbi:MAG: hypothetical protein C0482_22455 [Gordonia sp.]|nr:hypothetical protein [Gordonia sp. (in: high G+C Gram-positive bacteria)]